MSSQNQHKSKSYSVLYVIYRRLRFIRFKKRLQKRARLEVKRKETRDRDAIRLKQKEFKLSEKQKQRIKQKAERLETRRTKRDLHHENKQSKNQARQEWKKLSLEDEARARKTRLAEKRQNKQLRREHIKVQFRELYKEIRSIDAQTFKRKIKEFRNNAPKRKRFLFITLNSTVLFLLSYFVLFLISQAVTVIAAGFFNYPTTVYYYEVYFNIGNEDWYHDSVKTIFSSGPLVVFVIGITFLVIYNHIKETTGLFKLFFLWGFLHATNMLFGAMLVGTLFEKGVGHVISWMYVTDTGKLMYSTVSIFLLVVTGLATTKSFLITGNTYYNGINRKNRTSFVIAQLLLPYLAGNAFLILLRQPRLAFYDTFTSITLIITISPILMTYKTFNDLYFEEGEKKPRLAWISLVILVLIVLFFRIGLEKGIRFSG